MSVTNLFKQEKTFSTYNKDQAEHYAHIRPNYHSSVYDTIRSHHSSTGGQFGSLLDVGCGPGTATHSLAPYFTETFAIDPSEGMIQAAQSTSGDKDTSKSVRFGVSTASKLGSDLSPAIPDNSVDLIISGNAAHWFNLDEFWPNAARVLKPGGSVALWTSGGLHVHPSTPNAAAIEAALLQLEETHLVPYFEPGNRLTRDGYKSLALPWTLDTPVKDFDESTFFRRDWTVDEQFLERQRAVNMDQLEKILGVGSPVTRWREAHPHAIGTEEDVVRKGRRVTERLLHEAGVKEGEELLQPAICGTLLIVKKVSNAENYLDPQV
ncbi:hypothetical protein N7468_000902 [Penicillium chermesinum]|uniref:Methyltransferase type 11 domain-containing protein n=1 Tax=Penicillium chermesinum TaxID=63820 RepID=A0A9W9TY43_9EURO|nr:uncharacterized protein N7468_000902 [Penicillium chermesinum]KAJ5245919.1 hypothetical protein N7468_000902 [Penicillium chermesinum]